MKKQFDWVKFIAVIWLTVCITMLIWLIIFVIGCFVTWDRVGHHKIKDYQAKYEVIGKRDLGESGSFNYY